MENQIDTAGTIEVIIPASRANKSSFVVFLIALISFGSPFIMFWGFETLRSGITSFLTNYILLAVVLAAGMVLHELLHAVTFAAFCTRGFRSISFGIKWSQLAPFVHCHETLALNHYRAGTAMPGLVLGLLPCVLALITGDGWILSFGVFFTAGAAGDMLSLIKLRAVPKRYRVKDHPEELGFILVPTVP